MPSSVTGVQLTFNEPALFEHIEEGHHVGAINRQRLGQVLLRSLANGVKQQQNPVVRGLQVPRTEHLRKLADYDQVWQQGGA